MPHPDRAPAVDWRGWVALAWALFFGVLYARMVVERRGDELRATASAAAGLASGLRPPAAPPAVD